MAHATPPLCPIGDELRALYGRRDKAWPPPPADAIVVASARRLQEALERARDGATILVEDGVYDIGLVKARARLRLRPRHRWGARLVGDSVLDLRGAGSVIEGMAFSGGGPMAPGRARHHHLYLRADDVLLRDNHFLEAASGSTVEDRTGVAIVVDGASGVRIEDNRFSRMRGVAVLATDLSRDLIVAHNDFVDSAGFGGGGEIAHLGGARSIRQGVSPEDDRIGAQVVWNYVRDWTMESELVSIKSDGNQIAHNFVERSGASAFVVRMGNDNRIAANIVVDNRRFPVRISGERNEIAGNFFAGRGALVHLHRQQRYPEEREGLVFAYWAARANRIEGNVFHGYDQALGAIREVWVAGAPADGNVFLDNVVHGAARRGVLDALDAAPEIARHRPSAPPAAAAAARACVPVAAP